MNIPYPIIPTWGNIIIPDFWVCFAFFYFTLALIAYYMNYDLKEPKQNIVLRLYSAIVWFVTIPVALSMTRENERKLFDFQNKKSMSKKKLKQKGAKA